jgi:AraC-like DNA-binding protein
MIAGAAGISVRTLNEVLSQHGTSIMSLLNDIRLEEARERLANPAWRHISQISLQCGFSSVTSFNHAFKKKYNESPGEFRMRALSDASFI